ncbi:MAG TPA: hypothetical protein VG406_29585 [Isosphaeraceae bacterium]|jgi:hypothetical protein|nr:hypothetical protein [Isosphaeraceae bacterium]
MSRRIVPLTFLAALLLSGGLLAVRVMADGLVPDVRGEWDGFFQMADSEDQVGRMSTVINLQDHRRIRGDARLLDLDEQGVFNSINFEATVAGREAVVGVGVTRTGQVVFQANLETFRGDRGDAGVLEPEFLFVPVRGHASRVGAVLLRPFPALNPTDIAGSGAGTFQSALTPGLGGNVELEISGLDRGRFPGTLVIMTGTGLNRSFELLATTSDDGRYVMIGQDPAVRLVADGVTFPRNEATGVDALYRISRNDGRIVDYGAINFNVETIGEPIP